MITHALSSAYRNLYQSLFQPPQEDHADKDSNRRFYVTFVVMSIMGTILGIYVKKLVNRFPPLCQIRQSIFGKSLTFKKEILPPKGRLLSTDLP